MVSFGFNYLYYKDSFLRRQYVHCINCTGIVGVGASGHHLDSRNKGLSALLIHANMSSSMAHENGT